MTLPTDPVVIVNEYKVTRKTRFVAPSRPTANDPTYENWWETRGVNRARRATSPCKARSTAPTQIKVPVLLQQKRTPGTTRGSAPSEPIHTASPTRPDLRDPPTTHPARAKTASPCASQDRVTHAPAQVPTSKDPTRNSPTCQGGAAATASTRVDSGGSPNTL